MKKSIIIGAIVVIIILVAGGIYFYLAQPAVSPTKNTQNNIEPLVSNGSDKKTLQVASLESKATYSLNEELRGTPTHVVGNTSDISGTVSFDVNATQKIQIGEIKVNARTFKTDIDMRDQNVRKLILKSDEPANEFIVFKTTNVTGVPATIERDKDFPVTITGDITIAGVTKPVTFTGTANLSGNDVLTIKATTMLAYENFGLKIPDFSFLANVDKNVKLEISLVAK